MALTLLPSIIDAKLRLIITLSIMATLLRNMVIRELKLASTVLLTITHEEHVDMRVKQRMKFIKCLERGGTL